MASRVMADRDNPPFGTHRDGPCCIVAPKAPCVRDGYDE
jgi:hypothetical protein